MELLELLVSWVVALTVVATLMLIAAVVMLDHRSQDPGEDEQEPEEGV